jgi:nicotinamide-nucleotide amidase
MRAEVIAIGSEVLAGFTVNTNGAFIAQQLMRGGYEVTQQEVVGDHSPAITQAVEEAMHRSEIVICSGGLGPTLDDTTRAVISDLFDSGFIIDQEVVDDLTRRFGDRPVGIEDQATVPEKAKRFLNRVGTAPGLFFETERGGVFLVPGVPLEMEAMVTDQVLPFLMEHFPSADHRIREVIHLCATSESLVDPILREFADTFPEVDCGIYPGIGTLSVHLSVRSNDETAARAMLSGPASRLRQDFSTHVYEAPHGLIAEAVQARFIEQGWTLSTAESCTGGAIGAAITAVAGSSNYFRGGVIAYSNEVKIDTLGVPADVLAKHGAVSEETVAAMAEGAMRVTGSDFSVAVSGIAGPEGGTTDKPVGTVWMAVSSRFGPTHTHCWHLPTSRKVVIQRTAALALSSVWIQTTEFIK